MAPAPRRRKRGAAKTVGLFVDVDPGIKRIVDRYAKTAHVNAWEVVEAAIKLLAQSEGPDGLPAGLTDPQPPLLVEGGAAAA